MPLFEIHVIESKAMRGLAWVRIHHVPGGQWGIGVKVLTTDDVLALQRDAGSHS